jgi:hypothetical protein
VNARGIFAEMLKILLQVDSYMQFIGATVTLDVLGQITPNVDVV